MIPLIHGWTALERTAQNNTRLGIALTFVAGATNAGGFLAVGQYTSHMTGVVSSVADSLVLGNISVALAGIAMLCAFLAGAMATAILVNWGLRRNLHGAYGLPLLLESVLLLIFGFFGSAINLAAYVFVPLTVILLCFIMGLQNAVITKISRAEIRTTHITGLVTDMGIELGKMVYINWGDGDTPVRANRDKLRLQGKLIAGFVSGGLAGALGFKYMGFITTVPLALVLLLLVWHPLCKTVFTFLECSSLKTTPLQFDVLIVGSGLAGLSAALLLGATKRVAIITKRAVREGSSGWAQGGIAAVWDKSDSFAAHIDDTLVAGAGLCDVAATQFVVEQAPQAIAWLQKLGVPFSEEDGHLHLTREGGHSARRIVHVTDATGAAVQRTLIEKVQHSPNITLFENHTLVDLITSAKLEPHGKKMGRESTNATNHCLGLYALDEETDKVLTFQAPHTILATGGAGKVYLYTTNPDTATGDGIAAAWRAGCRVQNMEFIQFHPTCLYHPHAKSFLISEAVRGEGGRLLLPDGTRFMPAHDARAELAPRDVVARAIDFEMKKGGFDCVYLDISHQPLAFIQEHFPNIYARCLELGIDISKQPIPVVPAAHYTCGGVLADLQGRTDVAGLYAVGETACSGLHGANRLASNSLVECMVFARAATADIDGRQGAPTVPLPAWDDSRVTDADESVVISHNWDELRRFMWDYVGIVRTNKRLERAAHRIALLQDEIQEFYAHFHVSRDLLELRNLVQVADLIVRSAQARHESRGLHFSRDYPDLQAQALPTVLVP